MALVNCGTLEPESSLSDTVEANQDAIEAVSRIDSYYLTPCKKPELMTKEDESLMQALNHIDYFLQEAMTCYKRHNGLIPQVK